MAYTDNGVTLVLTFEDEDATTTTKLIDVVAGATTDDTLANAAAIVAAFAAVTSAALKNYSVNFHKRDGTLTPGSESENQARANIVCNLVTDATHKQEFGVLEIPSPADTIFLAASGEGKNIVDIADANVVTLVQQFMTGAGQKAFLADRQAVMNIDPIIKGKRYHRSSRRG